MTSQGQTPGGCGIGEVAERFGLDADTIRFYERRGVLPPPARDGAGRRRYDEDAVHLIEVLLHLRSTGMALSRIAEFTGHVARDPDGVQERLALLGQHRLEVCQRLRDWTASLEVIDQKIADYRARSATPGPPPVEPGGDQSSSTKRSTSEGLPAMTITEP